MADTKISELDSLTPVADNDLVVVVDVSDTSMSASGTTKKALKTELKGDTGATGATGPAGNDGEDAFVYIAYASDDSGTDFTTTFNAALNYIAIKTTTTQIVSPQASDFTGLWKNYKGATGATGSAGANGDNAYVYIAYASDDSGTGFTMTFNSALDYIAIKNSATEIPTPQASDFVGLWKNYKGATGATGSQGPAGNDGVVQSVVAGTGISVNSTDPANPVVTNTLDISGKEDASNKKTDLTDNSDTFYPSQKAVKTAVDAKISTGAGNADSSVSDASTTVKGKVELAIAGEVDTGTDATRAVTPDALAGSIHGLKEFQLKIFDDATALATGDGKLIIMIPESCNGMNLVKAHAGVTTVSSSGAPTVQIRNVTQAADMLTTAITIDANENTSYTAATAPVIDTNNDDVATGDLIAIDVDGAGTGAKGLIVYLAFQTP
jgi:hypothetical protein